MRLASLLVLSLTMLACTDAATAPTRVASGGIDRYTATPSDGHRPPPPLETTFFASAEEIPGGAPINDGGAPLVGGGAPIVTTPPSGGVITSPLYASGSARFFANPSGHNYWVDFASPSSGRIQFKNNGSAMGSGYILFTDALGNPVEVPLKGGDYDAAVINGNCADPMWEEYAPCAAIPFTVLVNGKHYAGNIYVGLGG